ncbi:MULTISPECIES: hypothetical protein [unclassified Flavobacterium]|uniref:hypothetical protein n=1 Tax=unclassified Flavobacterium TaxID=196869 RepID=UPI001F12A245|nr:MULTISPECIES: hypothetical protein [unclassified Flavobacterium]UMY64660.1 hypothetical protein MKO97_09060 [Flavobacterium sp. HJ-32-4]
MPLHPKLLLYLTLAFIAATVVGTLLHEGGHFMVAELLGHEAFLHYGSVSFGDRGEITHDDSFCILLGGVGSTLAIGTTGLLLLYVNRRSFANATALSVRQWVAVFLSLFWLRQVFNASFGLWRYLHKGTFRSRGDESRIDRYLNWPYGTTLLPTAVIGLVVLVVVCFVVVPRAQRTTFVLAMALGCSAGYYLWLVTFGPLLLP